MSDHGPFGKSNRKKYKRAGWMQRSTGRVRVMHRGYYDIEVPMFNWFSDRADMLGVSLSALIRDLLTAWQQGVIAEENARGIRLDEFRPEYEVVDRTAGYTNAIYPRGVAASHLDASPLGLSEL